MPFESRVKYANAITFHRKSGSVAAQSELHFQPDPRLSTRVSTMTKGQHEGISGAALVHLVTIIERGQRSRSNGIRHYSS
jgi:hypothetical protein